MRMILIHWLARHVTRDTSSTTMAIVLVSNNTMICSHGPDSLLHRNCLKVQITAAWFQVTTEIYIII